MSTFRSLIRLLGAVAVRPYESMSADCAEPQQENAAKAEYEFGNCETNPTHEQHETQRGCGHDHQRRSYRG
ncbi:MAG: hypothetical protein HOB20_07775 [Planctomycetaceae bacterium]|nr:hypothetical protein [Planctomycetaceae bacterium]